MPRISAGPQVLGAVHPELGPVDLAASIRQPRLTTTEEFSRLQIMGVRKDVLSEDLRIDADPPLARVVPVLGDPVVHALSRLKVGGETTTDPGGKTAVAQKRTTQNCKVPTGSDEPLVGFTGGGHRCRIERKQALEQNACRPDLVFVESVGRQIQRLSIGGLDHQVRHYPAYFHGVGGERLEGERVHSIDAGERSC